MATSANEPPKHHAAKGHVGVVERTGTDRSNQQGEGDKAEMPTHKWCW